MDFSITRKYILLSLHPEKGKIVVNSNYFRYALLGAYFMDLMLKGEIALDNKRIIPSFRNSGDPFHDKLSAIISKSARPKRFSYWLRRFSLKSGSIFRENTESMVSGGILRHEKKYFLNIIPYNRYYLVDTRHRHNIITGLREVLLRGANPVPEQKMLIGLLHASKSLSLLVLNRDEKKLIRSKSRDLVRDNNPASEVDRAISEMHAAIAATVTAASAATYGH